MGIDVNKEKLERMRETNHGMFLVKMENQEILECEEGEMYL